MKPAMALKSFITYIKEIGPGTEVSHGGTFKADRTMRIARQSPPVTGTDIRETCPAAGKC
ncbi:MAG: hypothetical protein ACLUAR_16825 [Pilosibacter sp.]